MSDQRLLTAEDLLAGTATVHEVALPAHVLRPNASLEQRQAQGGPEVPGAVRLRPLTVGTLVLISRAARDDPSMIPLLLVKESMVEPTMSLDELRRLHAGLIHFLVSKVNTISGLSPSGDVLDDAVRSPAGHVHVLLAKHFGWSPEQVARLTPGQVAVYLAGVDALFGSAERSGVQPGVAATAPAEPATGPSFAGVS